MPEPASPATIKPTKLTDKEVGYSFIEFPPDCIFLEAMGVHDGFRKGVAYLPAQRKVNGHEESHIYKVSVGDKEATHVCGPIMAPDGSTAVTIFGCALTSTGMLYLCSFNRNSIVTLDLNVIDPEGGGKAGPVTCDSEIMDVASPNDVCFDPDDETILYVAGGTLRQLCWSLPFSNSARGRVYKIDVSNPKMPHVTIDGLHTLAGIEKIGDDLWIAQLFDIFKQHKDKGDEQDVVWRGNDGLGNVWLADNIDVMPGGILLCPAYSTAPEYSVSNVMKRTFLLSFLSFGVQLATCVMKREKFEAAIKDPEVALAFSNTFIQEGKPPAPIRLIMIKDGVTKHFEIDLQETRETHEPWEVKDHETGAVQGMRHFFNEQVTHTGHLTNAEGEGFLVCISFEEPRIMLLNDNVFREAFQTPAVTGTEEEE